MLSLINTPERVTALEEQYATEIEEGLNETRGELVEKIDSYLNYVVETWMEENKLAVEAGLRTEIADKHRWCLCFR